MLISLAPEMKEEGHVTYGFGRRVCVGKHVANNSFFIEFAMMLWACNIESGKDENWNVIPIDVDGCIEDGLVAWVALRIPPEENVSFEATSRHIGV
jgi:hypothetical protein